jgi:hypothetical protein
LTTHAHRPWYAGSLFSAGPRRPLTRDQRRIWTAQLELHRRSRAITATHRDVGKALLARLGEDGRLDPSQDTLAVDAGCCPRTVREALRRLNRLGLASWLRRLVRTRQGVRQTSNGYSLHLSDAPAVAVCCGGRTCRETSPSVIPPLYPPPQPVPLLDRAAALEVLAQRRREREAALAELFRKDTPDQERRSHLLANMVPTQTTTPRTASSSTR